MEKLEKREAGRWGALRFSFLCARSRLLHTGSHAETRRARRHGDEYLHYSPTLGSLGFLREAPRGPFPRDDAWRRPKDLAGRTENWLHAVISAPQQYRRD